MKILDLGSLNIDYVFQVDSIVIPGQTILSNEMVINSGGKGFNQAVAAAKAGADVFLAGAVGKKDFAIFQEILDAGGVNSTLLDTNHLFTGSAMIQVDENGQNGIVLYGGANQEITQSYVCEVFGKCDRDDVLLLQNEISQLPFIMEHAHQKGMKIFMNPSPVNSQILHCPMEYVDTLILNEIEGAQLSGCDVIEDIPDALLKMYPQIKIVLTLGKKGVIYADRYNRYRYGTFDVTVVDTTAAGDTFTGYYLASVLQDGDIERALETASAAASIAVSRPGASCSIPAIKEVKEFLLMNKNEMVK